MSRGAKRTCRVCPTPIFFAADADHPGKLQVLDDRAPVYEVFPDGTCRRADPTRFFVSHWSTCTDRERVKAEQAARAPVTGA